MKIAEWEKWLVEQQWNGYPLNSLLYDAMDAEGDLNCAYRALVSLHIISNGINGEAGEASEHFKKYVRDGKLNRKKAAVELGDTLAYLTWLAKALGYSLDDIAKLNFKKLTKRGAPKRKVK